MLFGTHYVVVSVAVTANSGSLAFPHLRPWSSSRGSRGEARWWRARPPLTSSSVCDMEPVPLGHSVGRGLTGRPDSAPPSAGASGAGAWPQAQRSALRLLSARRALVDGWRRRRQRLSFSVVTVKMSPCPVLPSFCCWEERWFFLTLLPARTRTLQSWGSGFGELTPPWWTCVLSKGPGVPRPLWDSATSQL